MANFLEHYENHLADYYSWLFGGLQAKCQHNKEFFLSNNIKPSSNKVAVDLGCGSGFQSIPLAELGFKVLSIDLSEKLLNELNENQKGLGILTIKDDLLNFDKHISQKVGLCVCMGDTLVHLESKDKVEELFKKIYQSLEEDACFILTFRDMTFELKDEDRFIPVNSDDSKIFTCFLEYEKEKVKIHDIVYEKKDGKWNLKKSFYRKLRISPAWTIEELKKVGFRIEKSDSKNGLITIIAKR